MTRKSLGRRARLARKRLSSSLGKSVSPKDPKRAAEATRSEAVNLSAPISMSVALFVKVTLELAMENKLRRQMLQARNPPNGSGAP